MKREKKLKRENVNNNKTITKKKTHKKTNNKRKRKKKTKNWPSAVGHTNKNLKQKVGHRQYP